MGSFVSVSRLPTTGMESQFIKAVGDETQRRVVRDESVLDQLEIMRIGACLLPL